jgi:predicted ATPase
MGKTRLAEASLEMLAYRYEGGGGACFCDLTQAKDDQGLVYAVASLWRDRTHSLQLAANDVDAQLRVTLADLGPTLLVLDNFEQIASSAPLVAAWCRSAPELTVLVTSRERLGVAGEEVLELGPLACPAEDEKAETLWEMDAVRLFVARARAAGGDPGEDAAAVARVVQRLDGIPLAIELAAARTRVMSTAELAQKLSGRMDILSRRAATAEDRHATLASAIDWSWNLLSEAEQRALVSCSVFAGSFGPTEAESVIGDHDALSLLVALRDKSLVHATEGGRLALYVSIREYATRKLLAMPASVADGAHKRHALAYASAVRPFNESRMFQGTHPDSELRARLTQDRENLQSALGWLMGRPFDREIASAAAELAVGLSLLQEARVEPCIEVLSLALAANVDRGLAVRILFARQFLWNTLGRFAENQKDLTALLAMTDVAPGVRTLALVYQGIQLRYQGQARRAWQCHVEADAALAALGLPRLTAMNTACMGRLRCDFGDKVEGRAYNERSRALCDRIGDSWLYSLSLGNLGQLEQELGNMERATELITEAVTRFRDASEPHYEAVYACALGDIAFECGKPDLARRHYGEAESFFKHFPANRQTAVLAAASAALEAMYGDLSAAEGYLEIAKRSALSGESPFVRGIVTVHEAAVALRRARDTGAAADGEGAARALLDDLAADLGPRGELLRTSLDARFSVRMLEAALRGAAEPVVKDVADARSLTVAETGEWFELGGKRQDLTRRGSLKRILRALVLASQEPAEHVLGKEALLAAGWPGEKLHPDAASKRLRVAIATLRSFGLRDVLRTKDEGYVLLRGVKVVTLS